MKVNDGSSTSFWFDNQSTLGRLEDLTGIRGHIDLGISATVTVASVQLTHRRRRHRGEALNMIEDAIEELRQGERVSSSDIHLWKGTGNKYKNWFDTKETWLLSKEVQTHADWHKGVWFPYSTPKYTFLTWLATKNRLQTGDRTKKWSLTQSNDCILCSTNEESRDHLFLSVFSRRQYGTTWLEESQELGTGINGTFCISFLMTHRYIETLCSSFVMPFRQPYIIFGESATTGDMVNQQHQPLD